MFIATLMLSTLLALVYAMSGSMKLAGQAQSVQIRDHLGVQPTLWRTIGLLEVAAAAALLAGLALAPLGAAAAVGLALLMIGAGIHHHRAHNPLNSDRGRTGRALTTLASRAWSRPPAALLPMR